MRDTAPQCLNKDPSPVFKIDMVAALWVVSHSPTSLPGQQWMVHIKPLESIFCRNHFAMSVGLSQEQRQQKLKDASVHSKNVC